MFACMITANIKSFIGKGMSMAVYNLYLYLIYIYIYYLYFNSKTWFILTTKNCGYSFIMVLHCDVSDRAFSHGLVQHFLLLEGGTLFCSSSSTITVAAAAIPMSNGPESISLQIPVRTENVLGANKWSHDLQTMQNHHLSFKSGTIIIMSLYACSRRSRAQPMSSYENIRLKIFVFVVV